MLKYGDLFPHGNNQIYPFVYDGELLMRLPKHLH